MWQGRMLYLRDYLLQGSFMLATKFCESPIRLYIFKNHTAPPSILILFGFYFDSQSGKDQFSILFFFQNYWYQSLINHVCLNYHFTKMCRIIFSRLKMLLYSAPMVHDPHSVHALFNSSKWIDYERQSIFYFYILKANKGKFEPIKWL